MYNSYYQTLVMIFFLQIFRPKSEIIMQDIAEIIKKYEDEFETIHALGKLEMFDELEMIQKERSDSESSDGAVCSPINFIKVSVSLIHFYTSFPFHLSAL